MRLLTVHEAAAFLELSGKTIRLYADRGILPCKKGKNRYRMFQMRELVRFRRERQECRKKGESLGLILFELSQRAGTKAGQRRGNPHE